MRDDYAEPRLEHLFDMHADLETQTIGQTPSGMRQIFIVKGGTISGPSGKGEVLPGGGDWASSFRRRLQLTSGPSQDGRRRLTLDVRRILAADPPVFARYSPRRLPLNDTTSTQPMFKPDKRYADEQVAPRPRPRARRRRVEYRFWALRNP